MGAGNRGRQFVSDIDVIAEDPEIYSVEVDCCYYYDEEIGEEVYLYPDDIIEEEGCYYVVLKFKPEKGYEFDDDTDYYINDTDPIFMSGPEWVEAELYIENNYY